MRDRKSDKHRAIASKRAGRKLGRDEIVHHANEDKSDNTDDNLKVAPRGKHTAAHNRARPLSKLRASLRMVREGKRIY